MQIQSYIVNVYQTNRKTHRIVWAQHTAKTIHAQFHRTSVVGDLIHSHWSTEISSLYRRKWRTWISAHTIADSLNENQLVEQERINWLVWAKRWFPFNVEHSSFCTVYCVGARSQRCAVSVWDTCYACCVSIKFTSKRVNTSVLCATLRCLELDHYRCLCHIQLNWFSCFLSTNNNRCTDSRALVWLIDDWVIYFYFVLNVPVPHRLV